MGRGFNFSSGSFSFNPVHRFQNPSSPIICQRNSTTKFWKAVWVICFNTPLPLEITIFREITASVILIPIIASFTFTSNSSPTNDGLPFLLNYSGGSPTSFCGLKISRFQFLTVVRLKCTADIFKESVQLPHLFRVCVHIYQLCLWLSMASEFGIFPFLCINFFIRC